MTLKASGTLRKALQRSIELSDVLRGQMEAQQSSKEGLDGVVAGLDHENRALREQLGLALVQVGVWGGGKAQYFSMGHYFAVFVPSSM